MKNFVFYLVFCLTIFFTVQTTIHAAGVIDRTFGSSGTAATTIGANLQAKKVKIQPDGKILTLGTVGSGAAQDTIIVRYNTNGSLDTGFGNNGIVIANLSPDTENANDLALQSDGKIIVVGNIYSSVTQSIDFSVARFNQNGTLDPSFGTNGVATVNQSATDVFNAVVVQPDDKIVAVGATSQNGYEFAAIRFNPNGTLDPSFRDGGLFFYDLGMFINNHAFRAVALLPNGRIVIGGTALESNGGMDVLVMLEPNGAFVQNFGTNGIKSEYFNSYSAGNYYDLALLPDGKILTISYHLIRRLLSNGTTDPSFRTIYYPSDTTDLAGTDLAVRSDGKVIVLNQGGFPRSDMVIYEKNGRDINRVRGLAGNDVAVQSDDKFLIVNSTGDGFLLTRYVSISSPGTRIADFDFDGKTDLIVSGANQTVNVLRSSQPAVSYQLNLNPGEGVRIMPEEYNPTDPFPLFYWRFGVQNTPAYFESVNQYGSATSFQWGISGDLPVGGDYDGESLFGNLPTYRKPSEQAIFRPSTGDWWIINRRTNAVTTYHWGTSGDKPVPADYDYDGITDYAVYRPSTGVWWIHRSADDSYFTIPFGIAADIPLTGDFDGDGRADFTVYRPSEGNWYQLLTTEGFRVVRFGISTDIPVPGDYDGDGRTDIAVFRSGLWYLLQSSEGFKVVQWGNAADSPVAIRYDQ
jgi:uncharacterized delta-60 repeat protein